MARIILIRHGQASFGHANYDQLSPIGEQQATHLGSVIANRYGNISAVALGDMVRHQQTATGCVEAIKSNYEPQQISPPSQLLSPQWITNQGFNEYNHEEVIVRHKPSYADKAIMLSDMAKQKNPRKTFQKMFVAAMQRWVDGAYDSEYTESWQQFKQRTLLALSNLIYDVSSGNQSSKPLNEATNQATSNNDETLLIFTSGGVITAIVQQLLNCPDAHAFRINWALANAGMTTLLFSKRDFTDKDGSAAVEKDTNPQAILDNVTLSTLNDYSHFQNCNVDNDPGNNYRQNASAHQDSSQSDTQSDTPSRTQLNNNKNTLLTYR